MSTEMVAPYSIQTEVFDVIWSHPKTTVDTQAERNNHNKNKTEKQQAARKKSEQNIKTKINLYVCFTYAS